MKISVTIEYGDTSEPKVIKGNAFSFEQALELIGSLERRMDRELQQEVSRLVANDKF